MNEFPAFTVYDSNADDGSYPPKMWSVKIPAGHRWEKDSAGDLVVYPIKKFAIQVYDRPVTLPTGLTEVARFRDGEWTHVMCDFPE